MIREAPLAEIAATTVIFVASCAGFLFAGLIDALVFRDAALGEIHNQPLAERVVSTFLSAEFCASLKWKSILWAPGAC